MGRLSSSVEKPFSKTLKWKNEKFDKKLKQVTREKGWYYYVPGEEGEEGKNVMIEMPFTFVWLENATSFTGYNEASGKGIYSNEVLSEQLTKEMFPKKQGEGVEDYYKRIKSYMKLTAKMDKDVIAEGLYKDIKNDVVAQGGKFCMPVYALLQTNEGTETVRILMTGGSVETWLPFQDRSKLKNLAVSCNGSVEKERGSNQYEAPKFQYVTATPQLLKEADAAAAKVEEYFKYILDKTELVEEPVAAEGEGESQEDSGKFPWD